MRNHSLLLAILAVIPGCSETLDTEGCIMVEDDAKTCPAANEVPLDDVFLTSLCGDIELVEVKGQGQLRERPGNTPEGQGCCYTVEVIDHNPDEHCIFGRPYFDVGTPRLAAMRIASS